MKDSLINFANDIAQPLLYEFPFGTACIFSLSAANKEGPNEDSLALLSISEKEGLIIIADGVGGHARGDEASRIAVEAIRDAVDDYDKNQQDLRDLILRGIDEANNRILAMEIGAATTIVAIEITERRIRCYHAGDSTALVIGQRGKLKFQTISHSPVGYALESGLISEHEAMQADDRNVVSNIVGCSDMRVDMGAPLKLADRDTVLLSSDGLTDNMMLSEIIETVRKGPLLQSAIHLKQLCLEKMKQPDGHYDDLSVILFRPSH